MRSRMNPHASKQDFKLALAGIQFPSAKAAVLARARDHGGLDHEVKQIVEQLSDRTYVSAIDLDDALRAVYMSAGAPAISVPI